MAHFIEIVDESDTVKIINVDNIAFVNVNSMAICSLKMNNGSKIETGLHKETLLKKLKQKKQLKNVC
jgi:hypothetical protein